MSIVDKSHPISPETSPKYADAEKSPMMTLKENTIEASNISCFILRFLFCLDAIELGYPSVELYHKISSLIDDNSILVGDKKPLQFFL